jgi:hypothetical protein
MGNRRAGYEAAKLSVKRQPQPVADNRSMERRESIGQCLRGRTIDDLTDLEILEKRPTYELTFHRLDTCATEQLSCCAGILCAPDTRE